MSAFVCTQKHFETVKTSLEHHWNTKRDQSGIFNRLFWPNDIEHVYNEINSLISTLQKLNVETVAYKYAHGDTEKAKKESSEYIEVLGKLETGKKISLIQLYKALQCIDYQIELEHLTRELTTLEKESLDTLEKLISGIPEFIVRSNNEYQEAAWAID